MVQKRTNPALEFPAGGTDEVPYIAIRTGEMFLNASEAAFETGKMGQAMGRLNTLRERVGMPKKTEITLDVIKN